MPWTAGDGDTAGPLALVAVVDDAVRGHLAVPNRAMAPVRWYGGKGNLAPWIVRHLPREGVAVYCEPYAGAASVLWHLPSPYPVEVLNDLDERIVTLFRVLQDRERFADLCHRLLWTPYARPEFARALEILRGWDEHDDITRAWAFFVAQNQGFAGKAETLGDWGRVLVSDRGMATSTSAWRSRLGLLPHWHDRLTRVQIDCRDAIDVIRYWDSPGTLFYCDPPYHPETRVAGSQRIYAAEADDAHHAALVETLLAVRGMVVLSGYARPVHEPLAAAGWQRIDRQTACHVAGRVRGSGLRGNGAALARVPRTESLWINPAAQRRRLL